MQVKLGPLVTHAAGSLGGSTFQRHPVATLVRVKPLPTRRRNAYTAAPRQSVSQLSRLWSSIHQSERDDWQALASSLTWANKFGDTISGQGYWLFMRCNLNLSIVSKPPIAAPSHPPVFDPLISPSLTLLAAGSLKVDWSTPSPLPAYERLVVACTPPRGGGRRMPPPQMITTLVGSGGLSPSVDLYTEYLARFGTTPLRDQRTAVRIYRIDDTSGFASDPVELSALWS